MKKLLAIAVATALVAPAAAMADTTLYGKLHASVGSVKTTTAGVSTSQKQVQNHGSRIGVKGATALDNGMEATYGAEFDLNLAGDSSATAGSGTSMAARNTFVGVKGGFGEVRVGRHDTPAKLATAGLDTFADGYADMGNIISTDGDRVNNAVAYINKFGPVGVAVAHSTSPSVAETTTTNNANTFMVNYSTGPWYAGLGHTAIQNTAKKTNLGLGWKAEAGHNIGLVYETVKTSATPAIAAIAATPGSVGSAAVAAVNASKDKSIYLGGGYKMGNVTLKAAVGERKRSGDTVTLTNNGKEKLTVLGADYSLGKKTSVYLIASNNKNTGAVTTAATTDVKATAIGLVTEF